MVARDNDLYIYHFQLNSLTLQLWIAWSLLENDSLPASNLPYQCRAAEINQKVISTSDETANGRGPAALDLFIAAIRGPGTVQTSNRHRQNLQLTNFFNGSFTITKLWLFGLQHLEDLGTLVDENLKSIIMYTTQKSMIKQGWKNQVSGLSHHTKNIIPAPGIKALTKYLDIEISQKSSHVSPAALHVPSALLSECVVS